jgi:small ligand-binding sensory domain FIST
MKVATGIAIGAAAKPELAALAVQNAMRKAGITAPSSVLLFLSSEFAADPQSAIKAAAKAANCTQIIGCSATGIFTEEDWVIDSPAAAAMVFSELNFSAPSKLTDDLILTLSAPHALNTSWLNTPNSRFGGVSGDAIGHGPFSVWQNAKGTTQGYCELVLNNTNGVVAASHGLKLLSTPRKISAANNHDVLSLGNANALNALTSAWQKHAKSTDSPPTHQLMAVHASKAALLERGDYHITSLISCNDENGSVTIAKPLPVGEFLSWAIRDVDAAQMDIVKTTNALKRQLTGDADFGLLFSCLGRGPYFYDGIDQDLALIKTLLPHLPLIGFYGNGEIAPINGKNELLQYSAVLGLFAQK